MSHDTSSHIFSRFDGDVAAFRQQVLDFGQLACEQVLLAGQSVGTCDIAKAQRVQVQFKSVRDLDIDLFEANEQLLALHHPVASDLRYMIMLSRTAYDLERINLEAVRLAKISVDHYEQLAPDLGCELLEDIPRMTELVVASLQSVLAALADRNVNPAVEIIQSHRQVGRLFEAAVRRLVTYIMQDPRTIQWSIDVTVVLKGLERIADHTVGIAKNMLYCHTGRDVRHVNPVILDEQYLSG